MTTETLTEEQWEATSYFDAADELFDFGWYPDAPKMTLADLDASFVAEARRFADRVGAPWPPHLPWAEEDALANPDRYGR